MPPPVPRPQPQGRSLRVLIVEDDPHVRRVLKRILEGLASDVLECANGADALGVYTSFEPDAVLMDIRLPGVDGLTATRRIRAAFPSASVLIVTNHDEAPLRKAALDAGARGYVLKDNLLDVRTLLAEWFAKA